ncbi:cytochrome C, partial [Campylobacter jejuni]|nr:cytochrome C [Campylobacter jejuni]
HFTDQETIYDIVVGWQKPVKDGYENILKGVKEIDKAMAENPKLSVEKKSRVITLANQARAIAEKLQ